jgi:hypothetical protein
VLPLRPFLGTWRGALVARERDLLPVPRDTMPPELLAMSREMCTAYRLLEDYGRLKVRGGCSQGGALAARLKSAPAARLRDGRAWAGFAATAGHACAAPAGCVCGGADLASPWLSLAAAAARRLRDPQRLHLQRGPVPGAAVQAAQAARRGGGERWQRASVACRGRLCK